MEVVYHAVTGASKPYAMAVVNVLQHARFAHHQGSSKGIMTRCYHARFM